MSGERDAAHCFDVRAFPEVALLRRGLVTRRYLPERERGPVCRWRQVGGRWETACGEYEYNRVCERQGWAHCPFCGGRIVWDWRRSDGGDA